MSELFDKVDKYLEKFNTELTNEDRYLDFRLGIDEFDNIYKWEFPNIPKPTDQELDELKEDEIKENKNQKILQKKLKSFRIPAINSNMLKIKDLKNFEECLFFNTSSKKLNYILDGKVIIL